MSPTSPRPNRRTRRIQRSEARRARRRERLEEPTLGLPVRTFVVGERTLDVAGSDDSLDPEDDCPLCRAVRTLEEYEAAGTDATPELAERAEKAMALLSGDIPWPVDDVGLG
jgi:hypothetical protein